MNCVHGLHVAVQNGLTIKAVIFSNNKVFTSNNCWP